MRQKSGETKEPAVRVVRYIRRAIREQYSAEEKIRIVLEALRGEESIFEFYRCRRSPPLPVGDIADWRRVSDLQATEPPPHRNHLAEKL